MRAQTKARSFHFFARRRGGVVQVQTERFFFVMDPPPRARLVLMSHLSWPGVHYVRKKGQSLNWLWVKQSRILKGDWPQ